MEEIALRLLLKHLQEHEISSELGIVIGAITQSQRLISQALEMEQKGGRINMCSALEELKKE